MNKKSDFVINWRRRTKDRMVEAFGGECSVCKQKFQPELYDFHHLSPSEKEFSLGKIRANCISWERIVVELRKCIMVCSNCHRLIHYGYIDTPQDAKIFDENFAEYKVVGPTKMCEVCGKDGIPKRQRTCSRSCSAKLSRTVDWGNIDLVWLKKTMSNAEIARKLDISEAAVGKRLKKIQNIPS